MASHSPLTPERWKKVDGLVQAALSEAQIGRAAFLQNACDGDEDLRQEVEKQLAFVEQSEGFLEVPALERAAVLVVCDESESLEGRTFGRYAIQNKIGSGGMGEVYQARDTKLERAVALKVLSADLAADAGRLSRFTREAKSASALNHPNIITVHEIGDVNSTHFIVTEFIEGITLRERMREGRLAIKEILAIAGQVADALAAAHMAGIVHRDIKPENIMIRRDGYVKVLDFGLAKLLEPAVAAVNMDATTKVFQTEPGMVMGTVEYMSPEQARGLELDARTDVWSLGVVMYEMIAGHSPFAGATKSHVIVSILEDEPQPLTKIEPNIPEEFQRIVRKTLTKEIEKRYQTSRDLRIDLDNLRRDIDLRAKIRSHESNATAIAPKTELTPDSRGRATEPTGQVSPRNDSLWKFSFLRWRNVAIVSSLIVVLVVGFIWWQRGRPGPIASKPRLTYDSVAVLPIKSVGDKPDDVAYLADGVSELLITKLAQLPNLRVVPWVTSQQYRDSKKSLKDLANEMQVKAIITGTLRRAGDRIDLSVSLIDADSEAQSWGDDFEEATSDIFSMQRKIALEAATNLKGKLTTKQEQELAQQPSQSAEAYELYLRGNAAVKQNRESNELALGLYQRASKLDPNMAEAYVGIGLVQWRRYYFGWGGAFKDLDDAEANFQKALNLKPDLSGAYRGLMNLYNTEGRDEECLKLARKLGELRLEDASTLATRALAYYLGGLPEKSVPLLLRANELDPANRAGLIQLIGAYGDSGDLQRAADAGELALRKFGESARMHYQTALAYHELGSFERAKEHYDKAIALAPDEFPAYDYLGILYRRIRQFSKARETWRKGMDVLKRAIDAAPDNSHLQTILLRFQAHLGDRSAVLQGEDKLLQEAISRRSSLLQTLACVHAELGDNNLAIEYLRKAFEAGLICELTIGPAEGLEQFVASPTYQKFLNVYNDKLDQLRAQY